MFLNVTDFFQSAAMQKTSQTLTSLKTQDWKRAECVEKHFKLI